MVRRGPILEFCGSAGTVAAVLVPVDGVRNVPPPGAAVVTRIESAGGIVASRRQTALVVASEAQRLWVSRVTCGTCRRIRGEALVADLDRIGDAGLSALQGRLQLPTEPKLTTVKAWAQALERSVTRP